MPPGGKGNPPPEGGGLTVLLATGRWKLAAPPYLSRA